MSNQSHIEKIYSMQVTGGDDSVGKVNLLNKAFDELRETKKLLNAELSKALIDKNSTAEVDNLNKQIAELNKQLKSVSDQRKTAEKDAQVEARTNKILADIKLQEAKATKEQELANKARIQSMIAQDRELDRQIQKEEKLKTVLEALPGTYNAIKKEYKELYDILKATPEGSAVMFKGQSLDYSDAIKQMEVLSTAEGNFRRQFTKDKLLVGEYTTGIIQAFRTAGVDDLIGGQVQKAQSRLSELNTTFKTLQTEYQELKQSGTAAFGTLEQEMIANRQQAVNLEKELKSVNDKLMTTGSIGDKVAIGLRDGFKNAGKEITQFALTYFGFQQVLFGMQAGIANAEKMSDSIADLQIRLKGSKEDANGLVESLNKINTRTSLGELVNTASLVAKKGVAKEEIEGITKALDNYFVVAGKEAGNREEGTSSIIKLISIFNDDKHVTKERVEEISSALVGLQNSGVATGSKMIDLAERIGSVRGLTGVTLPNVLGLAAAVEQLGQKTEVGGTAGVQILSKVLSDVPKYAKAAGIGVDEFTKIIKENPIEGFVKLAQGLIKSGAGDFEEISKDFEEVGVKGARVKAFLADVGTNGEFVIKRMKEAGFFINHFSSYVDAATIKQGTFAATTERISNAFSNLAANKTVQIVLAGFASALALILSNLVPILSALAVYGTALAIVNYQLIAARIGQLAFNAGLILGRVYAALATIATTAYNAALIIYTGSTRAATAATILLSNAMRIMPLGLILTGIGLLAAAVKAFGGAVQGTLPLIKAHAEINLAANKIFADQTVELNKLYNVAVARNISLTTTRSATQKLIDQYPEYFGKLKAETATIAQLKDGYDKLTASIKASARAEASAKISAEKQGAANKIAALIGTVETEMVAGKNIDVSSDSFGEDNRKLLLGLLNNSDANIKGDLSIGGIRYDSKVVLKRLNDELKARQEIANQYNGIAAAYQSEIDAKNKVVTEKKKDDLQERIKTGDITGSEAQELIKRLESELSALKLNDPKRKELMEQIKKYQEILKPKEEKTYRGAKLTGEQKDEFKDIDANRDILLAEQKKKRIQDLQDEETYLNNILKINNDAIDKKLALIKGKNAEERKIIAELNLQKVENQKKTNDELFKIAEDDIKKNYSSDKAALENSLKEVESSIFSSEAEKIQAKSTYKNSLLKLEQTKYASLIALDKKYAKDSEQTERERVNVVNGLKSGIASDKPFNFLKLESLKEQQKSDLAFLKLEQQIDKVYKDSNLTIDQQKSKIAELTKEYEKQIRALKIDSIKTQVEPFLLIESLGLPLPDAAKELIKKYWEIVNQQNATSAEEAKKKQNSKFTVEGLLSAFGIKIRDKKNETKDDQLGKEGEAWSKTYGIAAHAVTSFYQNYFALQNQAIEKNKTEALSNLQKERDRALAYADSAEEKDKVNKKYDEKQKQIEKTAAERKKQLALKQATVDYGVAMIKTFAEFGFPLGLLPAAALTAAYFLQRSQIKAQQFAEGGMVQPASLGNGMISTSSNITPLPNGDNVLATVRTGEVILNENQQRALGGSRTFAALGVPGFAAGGRVFATGGVQPPVVSTGPDGRMMFGSQSYGANNSELKEMIENLSKEVSNVAKLVMASDSKQIVVAANEVEAKNIQRKQASSVGVI